MGIFHVRDFAEQQQVTLQQVDQVGEPNLLLLRFLLQYLWDGREYQIRFLNICHCTQPTSSFASPHKRQGPENSFSSGLEGFSSCGALDEASHDLFIALILLINFSPASLPSGVKSMKVRDWGSANPKLVRDLCMRFPAERWVRRCNKTCYESL